MKAIPDEETQNACVTYFQQKLQELLQQKNKFVENLHDSIITNAIGHVRYHFVDNKGPRYGAVTEEHGIIVR